MNSEPEFDRSQISLDEGHMSYLVRRRSGPWLILVPGSWTDSRQWADVVEALDPELSLVLVELRGHGGSWPPPTGGSVEQFAQDVLAVADDLSLTRFFVGGHSIGGMVSLEVGRVRPEVVKGVVSVEGWTRHQAERDAFSGLKDNTLSDTQAARVAELASHVKTRWSRESQTAFARIWTQWDGYDFLVGTEIPVLELWGDRGLPNTPSLATLAIPQRENIRVRWFPNASHYLPLERPREVAEAITEFVREVERGPRR